MATLPATPLTEEQYLRLERKAETKSEFHDGQMFAMAGGIMWHDPELSKIDPGERAAILALEEPEVLLLMDDVTGRAEADRRGIPNTGTLGILRAAAIRQILDLPTALRRLAETNFRVSQTLPKDLIAEDLERKRHLDV